MASKPDYLDRIYVASPCKTGWENMTGTEQVRYCAQCSKHVYDLEKLTRRQADRLIAINRGRFCARITRRPDGSIITGEESPTLHLMARRASPVAAAVVSAVISVGSATPALAALPGGQVQISSVSNGQDPQSSGSQTPFKPIAFEPVQQQVLDCPLPVVAIPSGGVVRVVPQSLRQLYEKSDLIVVGRAGRSAIGSAKGGDQIKTEYLITSVLKGKSRRQKINVAHYEETDKNFAEGKTALLFLSKGSAENGGSRGSYVLADFSTGIKALPRTDIDTYTDRIRELAAIEQRKYSTDDIIEWLVNCAEDPATRWEGAYELAEGSADLVEGEGSEDDKPACSLKRAGASTRSDQAQHASVNMDSSNALSATVQGQPDSAEQDDTDDNDSLAARLTEAQKERLVTALLNTQSITQGDLKLIALVKTWKEPRLLDFLLARLHGMEDNPPAIANELVDEVTDIVDPDSDLAEAFRNASSGEDASQDSEEDQKTEAADNAKDEAERAAKTQQAIEQRSAALKRFLEAVESKRRGQTV